MRARKKGDSLGGIVEVVAQGVPVGLGEPVFDRIDADIAKAMMSIPVGFTYATYGGLTITAVTIFGILKYKQVPNIYGVIGIALIVIGVVLVNYLGKTNS